MSLRSLLFRLALLGAVIWMFKNGGINLWDNFSQADFPDYAKRERVYAENEKLMRRVEQIVGMSDSIKTTERRLAGVSWPPKLIYIGLREGPQDGEKLSADGKRIHAYMPGSWTGRMMSVRNGSGYGSILSASGVQEIVIIEKLHPMANKRDLEYTLYLTHGPASEAVD